MGRGPLRAELTFILNFVNRHELANFKDNFASRRDPDVEESSFAPRTIRPASRIRVSFAERTTTLACLAICSVLLIPKRIFLSIIAGNESTLDTIHLSQSGHQLMADCVWRILSSGIPDEGGHNEH